MLLCCRHLREATPFETTFFASNKTSFPFVALQHPTLFKQRRLKKPPTQLYSHFIPCCGEERRTWWPGDGGSYRLTQSSVLKGRLFRLQVTMTKSSANLETVTIQARGKIKSDHQISIFLWFVIGFLKQKQEKKDGHYSERKSWNGSFPKIVFLISNEGSSGRQSTQSISPLVFQIS